MFVVVRDKAIEFLLLAPYRLEKFFGKQKLKKGYYKNIDLLHPTHNKVKRLAFFSVVTNWSLLFRSNCAVLFVIVLSLFSHILFPWGEGDDQYWVFTLLFFSFSKMALMNCFKTILFRMSLYTLIFFFFIAGINELKQKYVVLGW